MSCQLHRVLDDIIWRTLISANVLCTLEPPAPSHWDVDSPDGSTLIPWQREHCLIWNAAGVDTFAASHLNNTSRAAASEVNLPPNKKDLKYSILKDTYLFIPVAYETAALWGSEAKSFVKELSRRLRHKWGDPRSGSYLLQTLPVAIQRGNAVSVMATLKLNICCL
ncbi:hypothetical protein EVAR_36476_1 [Eumeta japonica]|uniref:Uncharacterized protein n=1 Tax=Eumeta variegata TaxID=151549 RepID=A0A4C1WSM4_EUMVA|nr:hypothetical protein EVAR_36476_1 [Eumeta japonica]